MIRAALMSGSQPLSNSFCVAWMGWFRQVRKQLVNVTFFVNSFAVFVYFRVFERNWLIANRAQHDRIQGSYWEGFLSNKERDFKRNLPDFSHRGNPDGCGVLTEGLKVAGNQHKQSEQDDRCQQTNN
ncbi:MAG: hypothetical protein WBQ85_11740 [Candidatus Sulfotelmatobacter sp.]